MPTTTKFADLPKIDLAAAKKAIDFKVRRERLDSTESHKESRLDAVIHPESGKILGTVPHDRPFLSFGTIFEFMSEQLKAAAVPYKIKDNLITEKGEWFSTLVFDRSFDGPDGESMVPMIIAKANYLNRPLDLDFGSYRFVCKNGVVVGTTIGRIRIGTKQTTDLARLSFQNQFEMAFERFDRVSEIYHEMAATPLSKALKTFVRDEHVPKGMKKSAIEVLGQQGFIAIDDSEGKVRARLIDEEPDSIYKMKKEGTRFDLYNALTWDATHQSRSLDSMTKRYQAISHLFAA